MKNDKLAKKDELLHQVENPIRFKDLTLRLETGEVYVIPGLSLRDIEVVTPIATRKQKGMEEPFITHVGPQEVTIKFTTYGIPWPSQRKYTPEKPRQFPSKPKQLPEHETD